MRRFLALVSVSLLAACSSGSESAYSSASELAKKAGCSSPESSSGQMFTTEGAECDGIYAYLFADDTNRDKWLDAAKSAGAPGKFVVGPQWVVQVMDGAKSEQVAKGTGGSVN